jgi:transposase-like protein
MKIMNLISSIINLYYFSIAPKRVQIQKFIQSTIFMLHYFSHRLYSTTKNTIEKDNKLFKRASDKQFLFPNNLIP